LENGAPKMATECDRFCWQELNVDLNNLVSGPLDAILTQPESYEIKLREKKNPATEGLSQANSLWTSVAF